MSLQKNEYNPPKRENSRGNILRKTGEKFFETTEKKTNQKNNYVYEYNSEKQNSKYTKNLDSSTVKNLFGNQNIYTSNEKERYSNAKTKQNTNLSNLLNENNCLYDTVTENVLFNNNIEINKSNNNTNNNFIQTNENNDINLDKIINSLVLNQDKEYYDAKQFKIYNPKNNKGNIITIQIIKMNSI